MLGKTEGRRRGEGDDRGPDGWMASEPQWTLVEQILGDGEGQGSQTGYSPWGCKELDVTEQLMNNKSSNHSSGLAQG